MIPSPAALYDALAAFQATGGATVFRCVVCRDDRALVPGMLRGRVVLACPACGCLHRDLIDTIALRPSLVAFRAFLADRGVTLDPEALG